jgi:uncharacterized protein (DUF2062 family)
MGTGQAPSGLVGKVIQTVSGIRRKLVKLLYHSALRADDTPHRLALGVGIGTFVAFTPTVGLQTFIALAIAAVLRANKAVCIPLVWITNPLTLAPIYWFCWRVGVSVTPGANGRHTSEVMARLTSAASGTAVSQVFDWSFWTRAARFAFDLGAELWLGGCIVGLAAGGVLYGLTRWGVSAYRDRRTARKARRAAAAAEAIATAQPDASAGIRRSA